MIKLNAVARLKAAEDDGVLKLIHPHYTDQWLEDKLNYVRSRPRDKWGAPVFASETAWFNRPALLPVDFLHKIHGRMGEQYTVRDDSMQWLMKHMRNNRLPQQDIGTGDKIPHVMVDYMGKPWVNEGNHRIMAAYKLGYKCLPTHIVYFTGGDLQNSVHTRPPYGLNPELVMACDKEAHRLGFTFDNYATHRNQGDRE